MKTFFLLNLATWYLHIVNNKTFVQLKIAFIMTFIRITDDYQVIKINNQILLINHVSIVSDYCLCQGTN